MMKDGSEVWEVHINGGRVSTGLEAVAWAREVERLGAGEIVLTSMDADGTKNGYDLPMTRAVADAVSIPLVASGRRGLARPYPGGADGRRARARRSPPASSITANIRSPRPKRTWPVTASRCASRRRPRPWPRPPRLTRTSHPTVSSIPTPLPAGAPCHVDRDGSDGGDRPQRARGEQTLPDGDEA